MCKPGRGLSSCLSSCLSAVRMMSPPLRQKARNQPASALPGTSISLHCDEQTGPGLPSHHRQPLPAPMSILSRTGAGLGRHIRTHQRSALSASFFLKPCWCSNLPKYIRASTLVRLYWICIWQLGLVLWRSSIVAGWRRFIPQKWTRLLRFTANRSFGLCVG